MTRMPLKTFSGALPALTPEQSELRNRLAQDVDYFSGTVGERNLARPGSLSEACSYIEAALTQMGYSPTRIGFLADRQTVTNLEVKISGDSSGGDVIIGAHYDTAAGTPGADDNATGVAAVLEFARAFKARKPHKTIRLVFFVNEEPPFFQTEQMGSRVYARKLKHEHAQVSAMVAVEMIGYYSDSEGSQRYPSPLSLLYPSRGNFIAFVGNANSRSLLHQSISVFRSSANFPSEGIAAPEDWPGVGWSDHWSFWQAGYPAIMVTDTALFRNPYYHRVGDVSGKVDYDKMARVVEGLERMVESLTRE